MIVATPSTSTRAPSTTIHSPTTRKTTEMLIGLHTCNKALTIVEIAHNATLAHTNASDCIPGDHKSSEALVFASCYTSSTETWSKGENVMSVCSRIPLFTPIATFRPDGVYTSNGGTAGIFLGCIPNGFKFAVQDCHSGVQIKHLLTGGAFTNDPSTYFVIRW
ncbi:hypothetical protein ACJMK2_013197 [Sinanodonta woodiana]|uniref:Uncharacterized protein n=1 Tax=Sinanodonta woodiana TaxID=1069815 RepID=A0ABD3UY26_SINWO